VNLKLNIIGRRRPGTTLAEHRRHIRQVHGEAVLEYIELDPSNAPQRYVQNLVTDQSYRSTPVGTDPLALNRDFVTQLWFDDFEALGRSRSTPFYREHLMDDEDNFVDQTNVAFLPCVEHVVKAGQSVPGDGWKLLVGTKLIDGVSAEDFQAAWSSAEDQVPSTVLRYVRNTILPVPDQPRLLDGIDEFWVSDQAEAHDLLAAWTATLSERLLVSGLSDPDGTISLIVQEDVIHSGPT